MADGLQPATPAMCPFSPPLFNSSKSYLKAVRFPGGLGLQQIPKPVQAPIAMTHLPPKYDPESPLFTGKERDTESGLDYFPNRYYGSNAGRWMSPDPSGLYFAIPGNPQTLNLYSYVGNNPLSFSDPSGLFSCGSGGAAPAAQSGAGVVLGAVESGLCAIGHGLSKLFGGGSGGGSGDSTGSGTSVTSTISPFFRKVDSILSSSSVSLGASAEQGIGPGNALTHSWGLEQITVPPGRRAGYTTETSGGTAAGPDGKQHPDNGDFVFSPFGDVSAGINLSVGNATYKTLDGDAKNLNLSLGAAVGVGLSYGYTGTPLHPETWQGTATFGLGAGFGLSRYHTNTTVTQHFITAREQ